MGSGVVIGDDAVSSRLQILNDGEHRFDVNGGEKMRLTSTGLGIGTQVLTNNFMFMNQVHGSSHAAFTNTDTGTTTEFLVGISSGEIAELWNENNTPMRFATNDTERIRIDNSGNVGIGTQV